MGRMTSICLLLFVLLVSVCFGTVFVIDKLCTVFESFVDNADDVYAQMDLINTSDAARRSLARSYLIKKRVDTLNLLRNLTTKVPYNCYDANDPGYNTSGCRVSRGQRQAEIDNFVKTGYVEFCKKNSDCKQASRTQYVDAAWNKNCKASSVRYLAEQSFIKDLLKQSNDPYVRLSDTALKTCSAPQTIPVTAGYENNRVKDPAVLSSQASVINIDSGTVTACSDLKIDRDADFVSKKGSEAWVRRLGTANKAVPGQVYTSLADTDDWLDTYWYFAGDARIKTDKDRLAKCSTTLSADDFVKLGTAAWQTEAAATLDQTAAIIRGGPADMNTTVSDMVTEYNTKRTLQRYPLGWYTDWQKAFSDRYVATTKTYNARLKDLNRVKQDRVFVTYKKYQDLIKLANDDIADLGNKVKTFDNGQYTSSPACFKPDQETVFTDLKCCNFQDAGKTYVSYCPEPTSACAAVVRSGNTTSKLFRNCKDLFTNYINRNKYNSDLDKFKKDPKMKTLLDDIDTVQAALDQALSDLNKLEKAVDIVNSDIAALK